jgi:hypothetical protein
MDIYFKKYLKYKSKYVELRDEMSGVGGSSKKDLQEYAKLKSLDLIILLFTKPRRKFKTLKVNDDITSDTLSSLTLDGVYISDTQGLIHFYSDGKKPMELTPIPNKGENNLKILNTINTSTYSTIIDMINKHVIKDENAPLNYTNYIICHPNIDKERTLKILYIHEPYKKIDESNDIK